VRVDLDPHPHFTQLGLLRAAARLALPLRLLILELPVVHDLADGGIGVRRDLHEILAGLLSQRQRLGDRDDAQLFVSANQANPRRVDALIDAQFLGDRSNPSCYARVTTVSIGSRFMCGSSRQRPAAAPSAKS
jgi:hypothetical protein